MNGPARTRQPAARLARTGEVLDLVRRGIAGTTTEIAAAMGVARSTVSERLDTLLRHDLLVPAGETAPVRGRPATVHGFNQRAGVTLVAQVGMSGTHLAVTDLAGEVRWSSRAEFDPRGGPDALYALLDSEFTGGLKTLEDQRATVYGIGVGLPGELDIHPPSGQTSGSAGGSADGSTHPVAARLGAAFDTAVFLDRDVNFMALGEYRAHWPDARMFLCLKVGTVIACGLVVDGSVLRGSSGLLGELGHVKVPGNDVACACGSTGCLNTVAGGAALAGRLSAKGFDVHSARELAELARRGTPRAGRAVRQAGNQIGEVVATAINLLNPDVVTVWGYLADAGDQFLAGMHEAIYRGALPSAARALTLAPARLGDNAGIHGAALTVIEHALRPAAVDSFVARHAGA